MWIKILLSIPLLLVIFSFIRFAKNKTYGRFLVALLAALGIFFIINPDMTTYIANIVGVGRGTDLMFYAFVFLCLYFFYVIYGKMRQIAETQTEIIRIMAIKTVDNKTEKDGTKS